MDTQPSSPPPPKPPSPFTYLFLATLFTFGVIVIVRVAAPLIRGNLTLTPTQSVLFVTQDQTSAAATATARMTELLLTATELVHRATLTAAPQQAAATEQVADFKATRTAIAVTRDPSLLIPATPAPIDLTVTSLPLTTIAMQNMTYPTLNAGECWLALANQKRADLGFNIEAELQAVGLTLLYGGAYGTGVQNQDCSMDYYHTAFDLVIEMPAVEGQIPLDATYEVIADVLAVLSQHPEDARFGTRKAQLIISFTGEGAAGVGRIDTGYSNALQAYDEGLRGAALVEALGGFVNYRES